MPSMRVLGRKGTAAVRGGPQVPRFVICPVCHLRNEVTARFCRDCGLPLGAPRDPVRGTTTRRADLPSERGAGIAAIVSLAAIVVIAGIAGFLVLRGFESSATSAGAHATAQPAVDASASPVPRASVGTRPTRRPARSPTATVTADPDTTATPEPTDPPTDGPRDRATPEPDDRPTDPPTATPLSTRTGWTCDDAAIQDPLGGRWRIVQARWGRMDGFDRLTFDLTRLRGSTREGTVVGMRFLRPAKAASRYDVETPAGDRALVITLDGPISLRAAISAQPGLAALTSLDARVDADGIVHAVLGITGDGCARVVANDWRDGGESTTTAKLVIDIRR